MIGWAAMTFGIDIHVPVRMKCNNFGDFVADQNFTFSKFHLTTKLPAKLMAFPLAPSVVFVQF